MRDECRTTVEPPERLSYLDLDPRHFFASLIDMQCGSFLATPYSVGLGDTGEICADEISDPVYTRLQNIILEIRQLLPLPRPSLTQRVSGHLGLPIPAKYTLPVPVDPKDARARTKVGKVPHLLAHDGVDPVKDAVVHVVKARLELFGPGQVLYRV